MSIEAKTLISLFFRLASFLKTGAVLDGKDNPDTYRHHDAKAHRSAGGAVVDNQVGQGREHWGNADQKNDQEFF
jgi:hypothetical protein